MFASNAKSFAIAINISFAWIAIGFAVACVFLIVSVFGRTNKSCLCIFFPISTLRTCDQYRTYKHNMSGAFKPCALDRDKQ